MSGAAHICLQQDACNFGALPVHASPISHPCAPLFICRLEGGEAAGAAVEAPAWAQAALPPAATGPARPQRSAASLSGGPEGSGYSASGKARARASALLGIWKRGHASRPSEHPSPTPQLLKPFLPFSEGPRNCVGQSLALVEIRAALALLLGHFAFELTPDMGGLQGGVACPGNLRGMRADQSLPEMRVTPVVAASAGVSDDARQAVTLRPESGLWMTLKPRKETQLVP